ncbi:hypothetical protein LPY66_19520 [Dehalobacter sp. DCM]|uniref:uroporphyrinogen decarboxylase family protein n=1 Tax=Dehalobacter sp. DCM TaxID=2907827 RepID=UPI0030815961|nr:hypothetical protein LPY66_19520 [Dehalobacter sp. DCM]
MSFFEQDFDKKSVSGIPTFLLANHFWIKAYYENQMGKFALPGNDVNSRIEAAYQSAYDDFQCTFGMGIHSGDNPLYTKLGNKAWCEIKKNVYVRKSITIMERTEYPALIREPLQYLYSTCLQRLYTRKLNTQVFIESLEFIDKLLSDENKIFTNLTLSGRMHFNMLIIESPLDFLADFLRGTKELLLDLHSVPELVKEACLVLNNLILDQAEMHRKTYNTNHLLLPLHLPGLLNRRDFEEFYYPTYNALVETLIRKGYNIMILFEGNVDRFIDIIATTDSSQVIAHFESTSIEEYQAYFRGKSTYISGFYPTYLLKDGTERECLDAAQKLKDITAGNDRFIFSTNKVLFTHEDASYQNLKNVYDFFRL